MTLKEEFATRNFSMSPAMYLFCFLGRRSTPGWELLLWNRLLTRFASLQVSTGNGEHSPRYRATCSALHDGLRDIIPAPTA